ncbi:MAG: hypothetical protein H6604_08520 [Flavobacteriales bacterium]|nr:hypothetical protein [Flavobacteriales bacterium]
MKKVILILVVVFAFTESYSQAQIQRGDSKFQGGFRVFGIGYGVVANYDYGMNDWFSLGGGADFYFSEEHKASFFLYGRTNFHLGELLYLDDNMDLYPGIDLGIKTEGVGIGFRLGFRYFFSEKLGAYIEVGSHGAVGVVVNL